jgi:hypothetical protein
MTCGSNNGAVVKWLADARSHRRQRESGRLAHHRIGARRGAIRISEDDLAAYLAESRQEQRLEILAAPTIGRVKLKHIQL